MCRSTIVLLTCVLAAGVLLPGCGVVRKWFGSKPRMVKVNPGIRLAGRVYKVNKEAGYVMIRRYGPWRVGEGEVVEARGEKRTANLHPTGERLGEHVAADIRSGEVEVGDGVYVRRIVTSARGHSSTGPEKPDESSN